MYAFTIAIPTLQKRIGKLQTLLGDLYQQMAANDYGSRVEILTFIDNRQRTIGEKRNWLLDHARGEFMAFVDDDDRLDTAYLSRIIKAIDAHPTVDVFGITGSMGTLSRHGVPTSKVRKRFVHSLKFTRYYEEGNVLYRCPNHLNPMRTEIAKTFRFPEKSFGEDTDWAMTICKAQALKSEHFLQGSPLYYYDFVPDKKY